MADSAIGRGSRPSANRFWLDGTHPGVLASALSANPHRERWRELAPRNRGNPRGALGATPARCQVQQDGHYCSGRCGERWAASSTSGLRERRRTRSQKEAALLSSMTLDPGAGASQAPALRSHRIGSFEPELGGSLRDVILAYETWGELNDAADNAVLLVHALTGDSHAAGGPSEGYRRGGWWDPMIGPGLTLDTEKYFVFCSNVIGGCSFCTGPASTELDTLPPHDIPLRLRISRR